jgi:hypothetical protein
MIPNRPTSGPWYELIWRRVTPTLLILASSTGAPTLASAGLFDARMFQLSIRCFAISGDPTVL